MFVWAMKYVVSRTEAGEVWVAVVWSDRSTDGPVDVGWSQVTN